MTAFATTDELAAYLQEQALDPEDTATLLLQLASDEIRTFVRQTVDHAETTADLTGTWKRRLELPERPVVSVSEVTVDDVALADTAWKLRGRFLLRADQCNWGGPGVVVTVKYTHGWEPADIPRVFAARTLRVAARAFANPEGLDAETIGSYSYTDSSARQGAGIFLDDNDQRALRRYRRTHL